MAANCYNVMTPNESDEKRHGLVPIPDPTILTTEALMREIANLRMLLEMQITNLSNEFAYYRDVVTKEILHLEKLTGEKFLSVGRQFTERDERIEKASTAAGLAVSAALAAAKEAVGVSERNTIKQIDAANSLFTASIAGITTQLTDLKERMDRGEGGITGKVEQRTEARAQKAELSQSTTLVLGLIGGLVAIVGLVFAFVTSR
jgi:hypothetical protein